MPKYIQCQIPLKCLAFGFTAELEDTLDKKKRVLDVLRRDPTLLKQFRPILEGTLEEKLESMGVKRVSCRRGRIDDILLLCSFVPSVILIV